jgi:biotin carboxylase
MNVLMISPGFPVEQPFFTRGLSRQGVNVIGLGDQHESALPQIARESLAAYLHVDSFTNDHHVMQVVIDAARRVGIDQVECTWEPYMTLAARIRETLGIGGMTFEQTIPFRDKEIMKQKLDDAGIRTPRHASTSTADGVRRAANEIGYPVCVKPIAGAGSADTHRVNSPQHLEEILPQLKHVDEVSVEEFIEADEFTFDTVCVNGEIKFFNIAAYRPRPLIGRTNEWISQQTICVRHPDQPYLQPGVEMGRAVLKALNFQSGFTHMEWYLKSDGEAVFGEIGARPPGANTVDIMNFANDFNIHDGWAEAVVHGRFSQPINRSYNAGHIFKRAQGQGHIRAITGLESLMAEFGQYVPVVDLLPIGAPRRNWKQTLRSDGMIIVRHPDFEAACHIADQFGTRLQMYAG